MAITGVSSISGEQIIAAGALSARSAATALYDENGNAITSYLTAVPEGYATTGDLNDLVTSISETYQPTAGMTAYQSAGDYYSASNPSGFITGLPEEEEVEFEEIDITDYQPVSAMTAYQSVGDYYSASNPSGFITTLPAGTMNESAFEYDANDKISGYNGSAFAGGSNTSGNYIPYTGIESFLSAFTTNSGLRIQRTVVGGGLNSNYMSDNTLQIRYINGTSTNNVSVLSNSQLKFETTNDNAYVDREKIHKWDSASDYIQNNSATISEVNTSYRTNSGNYLTAIPDTYLQNTDLTITDGKISEISGVPLSAGSTPTYEYTDNNLISSIDTSGLYATSALEATSATVVKNNGTLGYNLSSYLAENTSYFYWMPANSPWTTADYATGIFAPLQYSTGACLAMNNPATFKGFYKGNEWFIANTVSNVGQMLRGEVHKSRGVHISGATTAGYGFDLNIKAVSGVNSTGSWKYGPAEDAALRAVSSCDMHESAFGYDANDKISGYNGSAFAGGSDVPEGVMVESGLEYNAVNEISGYNGSAIAQYGAEKQWLVHDDTLVHASNSAQYALGVNVSAVAQLLGVDETELLVSTANSAFTLSEPFSSFNGVKMKLRWWDKVPDNYYDVERFTTAKCSLSWTYFDNLSDAGPLEFAGASWTSNNGIDYNLEGGFAKVMSTANDGVATFTAAPYPLSVIGIGRKS
jgi:hypothetical protein